MHISSCICTGGPLHIDVAVQSGDSIFKCILLRHVSADQYGIVFLQQAETCLPLCHMSPSGVQCSQAMGFRITRVCLRSKLRRQRIDLIFAQARLTCPLCCKVWQKSAETNLFSRIVTRDASSKLRGERRCLR